MSSEPELENLIDRVNELELARAAEAPRRELHAAEFQVALAVLQATWSGWMRGLGKAVEANLRRVDGGGTW